MDAPHRIIVIGTSAGGMPALCRLVAQLPATLPAALLVVQHLAADSSGEHLAARLQKHTGLRCRLGSTGQHIHPGPLYLAPPDRHLLITDGHLLVTKGPRENHYRPAVDTLFRSAAAAYGARVVGVVLTGMLHDGTAGLEFIKRAGGLTLVQDPHEAEFPSMPESALSNFSIDFVTPLDEMGALLQELVQRPMPQYAPIPADIIMEAQIAERVEGSTNDVENLGTQVAMTCPDCGGTLWEMKHGEVLRYRCHTGHAFTAEALMHVTQECLEESMWVAVRMLEERINPLASMARRGQCLRHGAAGGAHRGAEGAHQPVAAVSAERYRGGPPADKHEAEQHGYR
ncbi:chemotaxis protein CheB [Hymenobacter coalescens]